MGKRGPAKKYTDEERKKRRTQSVQKCRGRFKRCELEMTQSTQSRLRDIKSKIAAIKGKERITWNECMYHMTTFIEGTHEHFAQFVSQNEVPIESLDSYQDKDGLIIVPADASEQQHNPVESDLPVSSGVRVGLQQMGLPSSHLLQMQMHPMQPMQMSSMMPLVHSIHSIHPSLVPLNQ
eukprot:TRINITY_DN15110_c0_g1_i1.p1 TRINITY_DN15110_c0_g1~~TRINITY_DN15110_c0_g1_i1.p1  ORF type:complete len:179 (-),score=13.98 TRINITY_DN15110_c0_g1_i1:23-559(-)